MNTRQNKLMMRAALSTVFAFGLGFSAFAQQNNNWQNQDLKQDTVFGISTEKAYKELLKGKKAVPVIVGVLDGGVETTHEDLKSVIWTNKKEVAGNVKDDDKNGYIDDVHGWNFLGSAKGSVDHETLELTRILRRDSAKFDKQTAQTVKAEDLPAFEAYQKAKTDFDKQKDEAENAVANISALKGVLDEMVKKMGKDNPDQADFKNVQTQTGMEDRLKGIMVSQLENTTYKDFYESQIKKGLDHYQKQLAYNLNMNYDPRPELVGDNYADSKERFYGNNDVAGPDASHGTHVSGIIAADRTNNLGIKGVADHVQIMGVRSVPDGDERDKDVANAIRYAVENGAKVLNMSFGKAYSWDKKAVDDAVKYAMSKDVLIIQAAGNDNKNLDVEKSFPDRRYEGGGIADAYIVVGASGPKDDKTLKASFSNYGKTTVDVFAPGVQIYSTVPGSKYEAYNGTSMASPVVAGLASLIRSYYPKLKAAQVKEIIMKTVTKVNHDVEISGEEGEEAKVVPFAELSISGGIVNAYEALKLAASYK
ncbi:S8 family peptidase [Pedobacter antarcticus]|uniref:S8 family peptidase n=1 Tax=Pedobacter antarcticus TaxID=34086 RepID=UPI0008808182|nr:S8 family peptidase [Pedobacter antarcticus]SDM13391.1 Subtilase family protein [Pedobacter antarcticus]